jgi:uncharacterized membrane protein (TIGR02234 family)
MSVMRREFALVLLLSAAGAGLVVLAARQAWAQAIFTPPRPLPTQDFSVTGQELVPLASALALAALACLAAVIATRSVVRRAVGALLAVLGAGAAAAASAGVQTATVLAAASANATGAGFGGSTTSGTSPGGAAHAIIVPGSSGRAVMAGAPWRAVAVVGAIVIVLAGLATVWRGPRWPVMSARFDRPQRGSAGMGKGSPGGWVPPEARGSGGSPPRASRLVPPGQQRPASSAAMWESLSRDIDPTVEGETDRTTRADQFDGGTRG